MAIATKQIVFRCGRHRSRGRHARPDDQHGSPQSHRLQDHRKIEPPCHVHRRCLDHHKGNFLSLFQHANALLIFFNVPKSSTEKFVISFFFFLTAPKASWRRRQIRRVLRTRHLSVVAGRPSHDIQHVSRVRRHRRILRFRQRRNRISKANQ